MRFGQSSAPGARKPHTIQDFACQVGCDLQLRDADFTGRVAVRLCLILGVFRANIFTCLDSIAKTELVINFFPV